VTFGYVVRPRADRDIDEIADYLTDEASLDVALEFLSATYATIGLLALQPNAGWSCKVQHSELVTARTFRVSAPFEQYLVFYQPYSERIEILRVLHGSRDLDELFGSEGIN
jgi:toxin ParE1/3/4